MKYHQELRVPFEYDVVFTRDLFGEKNEALTGVLRAGEEPARMLVVIDQGVMTQWPDLSERIRAWCAARTVKVRLVGAPLTVPGGEEVKNDLTFVQRMVHQFQRFEMDRHAFVLVIGGGAVLDAVGLATAVFHRGLRLIRVPTTVLSQDDSGVGVKNGINFDGVKNMIGTFVPPHAVLNDVLFLTSLEQRDWISGLSEAFKVAILKDVAFLEELDRSAEALAGRDLNVMERVVQQCAVLHLDHIRDNGDPFEFGSARPLDFGHWSAHKLETLSNYELRHGEAVAIGIALDLFIAAKMGLIAFDACERVCGAMERCGLLLWHPALVRTSSATGTLAVVTGLEEFRQHLGGRLTVTLPDGLGRKREVHAIPAELIEAGVAWLTARHAARQKAARKE